MIAPTALDPTRRTRHLDTGEWDGSLIDTALVVRAGRQPDRLAVVDADRHLTYGELDELVRRAAAGLRRLGVRRGEAVAWQLPNWLEAVVVHHAVLRLGAVSTPIIPIYRHREVGFILRQSRARTLVVPSSFRGFDHLRMVDDLRAELPDLRTVIGVRGERDTFRELVEEPPDTGPGDEHTADDIALLLYTSGTTSAPKGVLHNHHTLEYENRSIIDLFGLTGEDTVFMPSPVSHITGILYGLHLPFTLGTAVVLQDVWNPADALALLERHRCSVVIGATPFLHGLVHHPDRSRYDLSALRVFGCGGADVPPELIRHGEESLGCTATRIYGSTEFPTLSGGNADDPLEKRATTDGRPLGTARGRAVTEDDRPVACGSVGELQVRGPELFVGYLDPELNTAAFTDDGWFRTGDRAVIDADGYVQITGRTKDIIVRGGENISAKEIEDLLFEHPDIADVAVVGMPDPVMVERICAYVVPAHPSAAPTFDDILTFLRAQQIANQKLPERLEIIDRLPRTATGKIQKFVLRDHVRARLSSESPTGPR
jgi:cyclohexanecarboxylate-CoA ligase